MIISKKLKRIEEYHEPCYFYNMFRLRFDANFNNILAYPCCILSAKFNEIEPIVKLSKDDIYKIPDLYEYLNNKFNTYTKKIKTYFACNKLTGLTHVPEYCEFNTYNNEGLKKIQVSLSTTCNLNCIMCRDKIYHDSKEVEDLYFLVLEKIKKHNLHSIELTALGEPFFYKKRTFEYLNSLTKNDTNQVLIISNATLLNDDDINQLAKINNTVKIEMQISFHSIKEETYNKIMNNNLYNKVLHNILLLNKYNLIKNINYVIQKENINDLIDTYYFFKNQNIKFSPIIVNYVNYDSYKYITNHPIYKEYLKISNS